MDDLASTILNEVEQQDRFLEHLATVTAEQQAQTAAEQQAAMAALWRPMSRSTIQRILTEADLKPHKSAYWLNSHDPDFGTIAKELCQLYLDSEQMWRLGELVVSTDEMTGILVRRRKEPTKPIRPGQPRLREHEYIRLGMRQLHATFCVPTGQVAYNLNLTHNSLDFCAHIRHALKELPEAERYHWVLDNNRTHSTMAVCALIAELSGLPLDERKLKTGKARREWLRDPEHKHVFHFTPVHGSWLNQVEIWFSVLRRRLLRRDDFASMDEFLTRFQNWMAYYNREKAHPYRWTYTGAPLVCDTPTEQTPKQKKRGRAFFSPRPKRFQRLFYPPRPYHKAVPA